MDKISILGCGTWGSALAQGLAEKGFNVHAWHHKKDEVEKLRKNRTNSRLGGFKYNSKIKFGSDLLEVVFDAGYIICAIPSHSVREVMSRLNGQISSQSIIVNVAKGVETESLKTMSEVIEHSTNHNLKFIVSLYGPSHAEEVISGQPTTLVAASRNNGSADKVQALFSSDSLRVYTHHDILGVELGGSLKNVIAIAVGICDGLGFGDNAKAALITRGLTEMTKLGESMGANPETFFGLSGIGDLIATSLSQHSRNRYVGEEIGSGKKLLDVLGSMDMVAEGVKTTQSVHKLASKYDIDMPISEGVYQVLFNNHDPRAIVSDLMSRDLKHEQN